MKEFDPAHPKWKFWCCHVTTAAYSIAFVEFLACSITTGILIGLITNDAITPGHRPYFIGGAVLAFVWLTASLILIAAVKRRVTCLILPHIAIQGMAFGLMLVFIVLVFMTGRAEQMDDDQPIQPGTLSIVMAVAFAAATLAITVTMVYILLKLKSYTEAEREHDKVIKVVRAIAHTNITDLKPFNSDFSEPSV